MRLSLTGRHLDVTPALRQLVTRRVARLERMLNDNLVSTQVVLSLNKFHHVAEITVHARGDHVLHGVGDEATWQAALKQAVDKIAHQVERVKGKWEVRKRRSVKAKTKARTRAPASTDGETPVEPRVIRARRYAVKPMSVEDAALKVDAAREAFLVFRNAATDAINVLYRRKDGHLGLIDPEA